MRLKIRLGKNTGIKLILLLQILLLVGFILIKNNKLNWFLPKREERLTLESLYMTGVEVKKQHYLKPEEADKILNVFFKRKGDTSGRTVLYNFGNGFDRQGKIQVYPWYYIIGHFDRFEDIEGTKDKYIVVKVPIPFAVADEYKVRITADKKTEEKYKRTNVGLEDLLLTAEEKSARVLPFSEKIQERIFEFLNVNLKKGDIVIIFLRNREQKSPDKGEVGQEVIYDDKKIPVAHWVVLRRYGAYTDLSFDIVNNYGKK